MWAQRARALHFDSDTVPAPRGPILDASGTVLVDSHELVHVDIAPREVVDRQRLADLLREIRVPPEMILRATDPKVKWVSLPELYIASEIAALTRMRGVHPKTVMQRDFATAGGIRRIVGRVGADGRPLDGIELAMDAVLRGDSTGTRRAVDVRGRGIDAPAGWRARGGGGGEGGGGGGGGAGGGAARRGGGTHARKPKRGRGGAGARPQAEAREGGGGEGRASEARNRSGGKRRKQRGPHTRRK